MTPQTPDREAADDVPLQYDSGTIGGRLIDLLRKKNAEQASEIAALRSRVAQQDEAFANIKLFGRLNAVSVWAQEIMNEAAARHANRHKAPIVKE